MDVLVLGHDLGSQEAARSCGLTTQVVERAWLVSSSLRVDTIDEAWQPRALILGEAWALPVTRLLRARQVFRHNRWMPELDAEGRTSIPRLYVGGAAAGLAAARDLGAIVNTQAAAPPERPPPAADPKGPFVCRCEEVTQAQIEAAVHAGALDLNQLKAFTRCGMGSCQGRDCEDEAAELVGRLIGSREAAGYFTGRAPLHPISLAELTGDYDYEDIPIPASAPL